MDGKDTVKAMDNVLADTYTLYIKTQNYHWNVTGILFRQLHLLFEEQYKELILPIDSIAERIRALGAPTIASFDSFQKLTTIGKPIPSASAEVMLKDIFQDQEKIIKTLRKAIEVAKKNDDEATVTLLADRLLVHEKNRWMLGATIGTAKKELSQAA